jgi:hypothetical protein
MTETNEAEPRAAESEPEARERPPSIEPPVFFNHENGPALTFYSSLEDHQPRLVAHWQADGRPSVITLERADVKQLRDFCLAWLSASMTNQEMIAEVDAGLARVKAMLVKP